jgi:glycosyltransferase involved in cell wall biosynthesis
VKVVSVLTSADEGGAEFAAVWLLDALASRGHETVLLTNLPGLCRETGVRAQEIDLGRKLSRSSYGRLVARAPRLVRRLRDALGRESPYDVLLLHFKKEQLLASALPTRLRPTVVWAEWGPLPREFHRGPANALYRAAARRADAVAAVSAGTKATLVAAGVEAGKVAVLPNAVRTERYGFTEDGRRAVRGDLAIPPDAFTAGVLSRFHPKKPNHVVLDAAQRLSDDVHVILAGTGPDESRLRELARPLGDRAHFVPGPGRDVSPLLSAFDVAVFCPSPTEGSPLGVTLPMLVERPVLATGAEGAGDLVAPGTGTILSPEHDPATLAGVLEEYRVDPERRSREGRAARERALALHSADRIADEFEALVRNPPADAG